MSEIIYIKDHTELKGNFRYLTENTLHYRVEDKNYTAAVKRTDHPHIFEVEIDGNIHQVHITSKLDDLIEEMGLNILDKKGAGDVFSPMPGLVVEIMVEEGEQLHEGQPLLILEAMKMENIIKSEGNGIVQKINVTKGEKIDKAQLLINIKADAP